MINKCKTYDNLTGSSFTLLLCCVPSHLVQPVTALRLRGCAWDRKTLLICLSVNMWMGIRDAFSRQGLKWLEHMLSLSELGFYFWFAPAGDGMEHAWSLSIRAPVDPSEPRSSPKMRRHSADLLFRGYSSPVNKKTIELCCWNSQGWAGAVQDGWSARTETERQERKTDRDVWFLWLLQATSCFSDLFYVPMKNRNGSAVCSQGRLYSLRCLLKAQGQRWDLRSENTIVVRCVFQVKWDGQHLKNAMEYFNEIKTFEDLLFMLVVSPHHSWITCAAISPPHGSNATSGVAYSM